MNEALDIVARLETLQYSQYWLPALVIAGGLLASKLLRIPIWATVLSASLPLLLAQADLPLAEEIRAEHPLLIMGLGWLALLAVGVGVSLARTLLGLLHPGSSAPGAFVTAGILASGGVVGLLYYQPELLDELLPGWQGTLGVVLLLFAVLSFTLSLVKFFRVGVLVLFWAGICVVLGSEVLLRKLPHEVLAKDLQAIPSLIPVSATRDLPLPGRKAGGDSSLVVVMGGNSAVGAPLPANQAYPAFLERMLNDRERRFEVVNVSSPGLGLVQMDEIVASKLRGLKPEVVVVSGWYSDAKSQNSFGIAGLSELEARDYVKERSYYASIPLVREIFESRLYNAALYMLGNLSTVEVKDMGSKPRLTPDEYRVVLSGMVDKIRASGALPVLFHQPIEESGDHTGEESYQGALRDVAKEKNAVLADVPEEFRRRKYDLLFLRDDLPSRAGHELIARTLYRSIVKARDDSGTSQVLAKSLEGLSENPIRKVSFVANTKELNGDLVFKLKPSSFDRGYYRVLFSVNDRFVDDRRLNIHESVRVRFRVPEEFLSAPAVKIAIQTVPSGDEPEDLIGSTTVCTPVPLEVRSGIGGAPAEPAAPIKVPGQCLPEPAGTSLSMMVLDYRNGSVVESGHYGEAQADLLAGGILGVNWGNLVALSLTEPLTEPPSERLKTALRYIGADRFPRPGEAYALVGVAGAKPGTALVKAGGSEQEIKLGSERLHEYSKFELEEVLVGERRLI